MIIIIIIMYNNNVSVANECSSCSLIIFFFREPTWQIFAQSCSFMEISLKFQPATSRNVSSSCSTTFWFTVKGNPGEKGNFQAPATTGLRRTREKDSISYIFWIIFEFWLMTWKKLDMENCRKFLHSCSCRWVLSMQGKTKTTTCVCCSLGVSLRMCVWCRHRFFSCCGTGINGCFPGRV